MSKKSVTNNTNLVLGLVIGLYPVIVLILLFVFHVQIRHLSVLIILLGVVYFVLTHRGNKNPVPRDIDHAEGIKPYGSNKSSAHKILSVLSPVLLVTIGLACFLSKDPLVLKLYPMFADIAYIVILFTSFFIPPNIVNYVINIIDRRIKEKVPKTAYDRYCFNATIVWCVFFFLDAIVAFLTAILKTEIKIGGKMIRSDSIWGLYNGLITYIIMGIIFAAEYIVIKKRAYDMQVSTETSTNKNPLESSDANT
ncbi:MAG: hypothetical protein Ta2B_15700 [Termitinemataceae bacterium]|nr:MAG: hypothetical protein Ta2B_15700 [Termitinemataceae bacterium]